MQLESLYFFFNNLALKDFVDLLLLYLIFFQIFKFSEKSGIYQVLLGLGFVALAFLLSEQLELIAVHSILKNIFSNFFLVIVLLFQTEIRRGLTQLGSRTLFKDIETVKEAHVQDEVVKALTQMSKRGIGALILFEGKIDLSAYSETGLDFDSDVKSEVLQAIFHPTSPAHDGAVIISNGRIKSIGAFLPLSTNPALDKNLGTRHRAALGIAELSDAKVLVVSEESKKIAFIEYGRLSYLRDMGELTSDLRNFLQSKKRV